MNITWGFRFPYSMVMVSCLSRISETVGKCLRFSFLVPRFHFLFKHFCVFKTYWALPDSMRIRVEWRRLTEEEEVLGNKEVKPLIPVFLSTLTLETYHQSPHLTSAGQIEQISTLLSHRLSQHKSARVFGFGAEPSEGAPLAILTASPNTTLICFMLPLQLRLI